MTCEKHCLHWEVCRLIPPKYATVKYYTFCNCAEECECFKDKSRVLDLLCKVGDVVYYVSENAFQIEKGNIKEIVITKYNKIINVDFGYMRKLFDEEYLRKIIFLTKEAAEQALKERTGNE